MAANARLKNDFTEDEKYHNHTSWRTTKPKTSHERLAKLDQLAHLGSLIRVIVVRMKKLSVLG